MANRPLRKKLYTLTQQELMEQIKTECLAEGVGFKIDGYGNMWSIRYPDKPIFVAHADTVIGADLNYKMPLLERDGRLSRPGFVLGADDRAGVNLILNHKHKINWIITKDEEIGLIGARYCAKLQEFEDDVKNGGFFIELDRRGNSDIIGHVHGYCEKGVVDLLQTVLTSYRDVRGVLTDIDAWGHIRQGVNLSVGYYGAHTSSEYLNISEFDYLDSKIEELAELDCTELKNVYVKPKPTYDYSYRYANPYYNQYNFLDDDDVCDFCGTVEKGMKRYAGYMVCSCCMSTIDGMPNEDKGDEFTHRDKEEFLDRDI
ncbi:MAG: hypothetical protein ACRCX2_29115, partial [Paraclostridium sp.]